MDDDLSALLFGRGCMCPCRINHIESDGDRKVTEPEVRMDGRREVIPDEENVGNRMA